MLDGKFWPGTSTDPGLGAAKADTSFYGLAGKRSLDICLSVLLLPFALPVLGLFAALLAIEGGSPFFRQPRVGRGGRVYRCWKLRTMVRDADQELQRLLSVDDELRQEWEDHQKLKQDPRITRLGRFLRTTSLDELPQIFNVLAGDMSLVGPRPFMVDQQEMYELSGGQRYYTVRPGITGPWQVSERNESLFADRVKYDDAYVSELSFATDVKILLQTVRVVIRRTGV